MSAINFRPGEVEFTAIAYCAKEKLGLKVASTEVTNSTDGVNLAAEARCNKGTNALSGGFDGETPDTVRDPCLHFAVTASKTSGATLVSALIVFSAPPAIPAVAATAQPAITTRSLRAGVSSGRSSDPPPP